ncbi:MAG: ATP-binding protein [Candidatus Pacebacteria bacterium]|nr:ATP-binding protein [Candidatus Paceibacterota bacterium]
MIEILIWATFFIVLIINFVLAFIVFWTNKKKRVNQVFALTVLFIVAWIISNFAADHVKNYPHTLIATKLTFTTTGLFALGLLIFTMIFPRQEKKMSLKKKLLIILPALFVVVLTFTDLIVKDIAMKKNVGVDLVFGNFVIVFALYFLAYIIMAFAILVRKYIRLKGIERLQLKYLAIGLIVAGTLATFTNFLIPLFFGAFEPSQFGPYFTLFFVGFTAFAIISKKLFGIRVVLTELFVGLIGLILLFQAIVAPSMAMRILNSGLFLFYCFFGYLLIRSVLREIELKEQLEAANKELKRLDEAKTEFLSIASHQLRTPLTAIKGYVAMVQEGIYGDISDKVRVTLDKVNDSSERLIRLVNSLLDISRLEMGRMEFEFKETQLEDLIQSIVDELYVRASKKKLKLIYKEPEKDLSKITIDPQKIRLVVLNLIDNAIKYTDHGNVEVKVEEKNGTQKRILITVSDTGMGISKKDMSQLFKIYRRGTGVRLFPEGSGVGLYVAKKLVEAHKGKIWAKSEGRGKGSLFYVELPINGAKMQKFLKDF